MAKNFLNNFFRDIQLVKLREFTKKAPLYLISRFFEIA